MNGRRIPDNEWYAVEKHGIRQPGDYGRVDRWGWFICDPNGSVGRLGKHTVTEHDDGTITVSPSILDSDPGGWHGWLERGVWRSV